MRPHLERLQEVSPAFISCHPNAGLPNEMGQYDLGPAEMGKMLGEFAERGWVNIVGGCCGTGPDHIRAVADAVRRHKPHRRTTIAPYLRLSGTRPLTLRPDSNFLMIGERTNVTGSRKFARLVKEENYEAAVEVAAQQVASGANVIDVNMDEALLDGEAVMTKYLRLIAGEHEVAAVPVMVDSSKWSVIEAGLKSLQGKSIVNSISLKDGEAEFLRRARLCHWYGTAVVVMAFDEKGQAVEIDDKVRICRRAYELLTKKIGFPPQDIIFDPNILTVATGIEEHNNYAVVLHRVDPSNQRGLPRHAHLGRRVECLLLVPRQRRSPRGDPHGLSLPCDPGRPRHGHCQRRAACGVRRHRADA